MTDQPPTDAPATAVNRLLTELFDDRNLAVIDELAAGDLVVTNASFGIETHGPAAFQETIETVIEAFPDVSVSVDQLVESRDTVVARWTLRGTHRGAFMGIEPTGNEVAWETVSFFGFEGSQIATYWALSNVLGFLQGLDVLPDPVVA